MGVCVGAWAGGVRGRVREGRVGGGVSWALGAGGGALGVGGGALGVGGGALGVGGGALGVGGGQRRGADGSQGPTREEGGPGGPPAGPGVALGPGARQAGREGRGVHRLSRPS